MVHDTHATHHIHRRKRLHVNHEKYPHPNKLKNFMDKAVYATGIIGPIMTFPQLVKIWIHQNASGISVISWITYLLTAVVWLIYGIIHKEKPIILTYSIWIILDMFIVIGILIYGG
ncbi:hypothetical protein HOK51_01350 [Candidatus Woesearchaeota archaeon]|jgi:uncharacterized protein with PQ loop repeat|nr:hypothetical protein [Candidatus Woesearchaeota archaeon]MBT6518460.1 hypothetical protein [Candidatus Woesearchaeota archaeon]MBT7367048.1 hypothetical protein [Candidatus Woesearchaeota archaeon]